MEAAEQKIRKWLTAYDSGLISFAQTPAVRKLLKVAGENALALFHGTGWDHDGVETIIKAGRNRK